MDADALAEQLLADPSALQQLDEPLPDPVAAVVVARLRGEADAHWWVNANRSLEMADLIIQIGRRRGDTLHTALGLLTRGDALRFLGQTAEAWDTLGEAGAVYQTAGDEVGWARTRVGRLAICVDANHIDEAVGDGQRARAIFVQHGELEKLMRLELNLAIMHGSLGEHNEALRLFHSALATAEALGEAGQSPLGLIHTNIGHVYDLLGDLHRAQEHHQQARAIFVQRNEQRGVALADGNSAHILMSQGHYRNALQVLHRTRELCIAEQMRPDAANAGQLLVECNLLLNRYHEARELARQIAGEYEQLGLPYQQALTLVHTATAEAELSDYDAAQAALDSAEPIFKSLGATSWTARIQLRRGRIALHCGDLQAARLAITGAAAIFKGAGQQVELARAQILQSQLLLTEGAIKDAAAAAELAVDVGQRGNVPDLRYAAHLLLGRVAEAQGRLLRAERRYQAATATIDRAQRGLTITLRPGFMEDKGEALRALIALQIRAGRGASALETLEHAKSQVLFSYLADREQLRWAAHDTHTQSLVGELGRLREEHHWLYRLAHHQPDEHSELRSALTPEQALGELADRERRMRSITEQLYLTQRDDTRSRQAGRFSLQAMQQRLEARTMLVEYYDDGTQLWAFSVDRQTLHVHRLPIGVAALGGLLRQLQLNIGAALARPNNPSMTLLARRILQRLYAALLEPLAQRLAGHERIVIVPYGALHYLPFHLLDSGGEYLIERHEVVVLPAAGLATRRSPQRSPGARALAHSWDGRLPHAGSEGHTVQRLFGGELYQEQAAVRGVLAERPTQILHIAAHGEHRLDQPDLSYIELADGQMYADDLMQQDLSYELVTLSACETGRAQVTAGDELIGLGRGFLYAGAGSLVTSLWRVPDDVTLSLMQYFYRALSAGASKAAALRGAQRLILDQNPQLHPALWGAFQLVGDAGPLSQTASAFELGEACYEADTVGTR